MSSKIFLSYLGSSSYATLSAQGSRAECGSSTGNYGAGRDRRDMPGTVDLLVCVGSVQPPFVYALEVSNAQLYRRCPPAVVGLHRYRSALRMR